MSDRDGERAKNAGSGGGATGGASEASESYTSPKQGGHGGARNRTRNISLGPARNQGIQTQPRSIEQQTQTMPANLSDGGRKCV